MSERCFRFLGVTDHATAEQIQMAYNKKVAHYKGPDYAEEPAYAHQKLEELHGAYAEAMQRIGAPVLTLPTVSTKKKGKGVSKSKEPSKASERAFLREEESSAKRTGKPSIPSIGPAFDNLKKHVEETTGQSLAKLIPSILSVIIAIAALAMPFGDNDYLPEFEEEELNGVVTYEEMEERDRKISGYASAISSLLDIQPRFGSAHWVYDTGDTYKKEADLFAKNYWGLDSIDDVTEYLFETYPEYPVDSTETLEVQLDHIFEFYNFASVEEAQWVESPYSGEQMESYGDYLDFLNQYYDEMQLSYQL